MHNPLSKIPWPDSTEARLALVLLAVGGFLAVASPQFLTALAMVDYQGVITFESFSSTVVNEELSNALAIWRNLWDDGMDLAVHAREFMANGIQAAAMAKKHC